MPPTWGVWDGLTLGLALGLLLGLGRGLTVAALMGTIRQRYRNG